MIAARNRALLLALGVVLLFGVLAYAAPRVRVFFLIDNCLDDGGCWVYGEMRCEFGDQKACDESR